MERNPQSNAPDTYTGPTTSPEGYPLLFGLRGGVKERGEDPSKHYVIMGAGGKPLTALLYDGRQFGDVAAIAEHRRMLLAQGYSTVHADSDPADVPGSGYNPMTRAEADAALTAFDAAKTDAERFRRLSPRMVDALQSRGWRRAAIDAMLREHGQDGAEAPSKSGAKPAAPASSSTAA
jgi:hypothetical protein